MSDAAVPEDLPPSWIWLLLALAVLALDQASKWLIAHDLPLGASMPITGFFNLVHVENPGAAFSFLAAEPGWQRWLFTGLGSAVSLLIAVVLLRRRQRVLMGLALGLILGGALGNVADRVLWGHVTDFLDFYLRTASGAWHWPAFNLADSAITVGAVALLLDEQRQSRRRQRSTAGDAGRG